MATAATQEITHWLDAVRAGDDEALGRLFSLVYCELRRIAQMQLRRGAPKSLSTTAVVHEAYLKLLGSSRKDLKDRNHFYAVAARAMRQILVDHARARAAQRRGGLAAHVELDEEQHGFRTSVDELIDLDAALQRLHELDARLERVVELRFFAGLSVEETAELLEVAPRTIKRDWRRARAFLYGELDAVRHPAADP